MGNPPSIGSGWALKDEAQRVDHVAGVVFEGSIALTAGAGAIAFTVDSGLQQKMAFIVVGLCALPGYAVGLLLLWNPLANPDPIAQARGMERKARLVWLALVLLLLAVPLLAVGAAAVLFFPEQLAQALTLATPIIGVVGLVGTAVRAIRARPPTS